MENGQNWCESSCHEVPLELFATNAPDAPHWSLNSCFGAFRTILEHLWPFCCLKKLEAKRAKLVQKFVSRSHFGFFCNECTRSTTLDPKPMFWRVSYYFDAFGTVWLARKTRWKTGRTNAKVRATKLVRIFCNECTRSTPLDPKLMFWCVSYYLSAFGTVFCPKTLSAKRVNWGKSSCHEVASEFYATNAPEPPHWTLNICFCAICTILVHLGLFGCLTKLDAERAELVQNFMPRSRIGIFHN